MEHKSDKSTSCYLVNLCSTDIFFFFLSVFLDLQWDDPWPAEPILRLLGPERRLKRSDSGCWHHRGVYHQRTRGQTSQLTMHDTTSHLFQSKHSDLIQPNWTTHDRELHLCVFRSWNCWWRATSSAHRSQQPPIRRHLAPTQCCRWPSSSRAGVETSCRRSASRGSSWSTSPAPNEQHRCVYQSGGVKMSDTMLDWQLCRCAIYLVLKCVHSRQLL